MVGTTKLKYKGKCRFINKCPCATGWCMNRDPDPNCIKLLISAYHNATDSRFTIFDDEKGELIFMSNRNDRKLLLKYLRAIIKNSSVCNTCVCKNDNHCYFASECIAKDFVHYCPSKHDKED